MKRKTYLLLLTFFLLCIYCVSYSQPFTLDSMKVTELKLVKYTPKDEKGKGRINLTQVTQVKDTMYFFVNGLSMYSPTYVGITAREKDKKIKVQLHKWNWKDILRSGSTDDKGHWEDKFKTETDFGIMVICKDKPVDYALTVWTGEEAKPELPTVFSNDKKAAGSGSGFLKKNWMYIVIGLLVIVIGFMFVKRKKTT